MNRELKKLALNARNRLINKGENRLTKFPNSLSPNIRFKVISSSDETFDNRAREILEKDSLNPIRELMDENYYKSLNEGMREKYLLEIIEKFVKVKKQIEKEERKLVY